MKMHTRFTTQQIDKVSGTLLVCAAALFISVFGLLIFILPQHEVSEKENRVLQTLPNYTIERLLDGRAAADTTDFYADQFPARAFFTAVKAGAEQASGKMENNTVIFGASGTLLSRPAYTEADMHQLENNVTAAAAFATRVRANGVTVTVLLAPRAVDVLQNCLPTVFDTAQLLPVWNKTISALGNAADVTATLTLRDTLTQKANNGAYVWYKTDHHWTTQGAYEAYVLLAQTLGYETLPTSYFSFTPVSDSFLGTTYSSSGLYDCEADTLTLARYAKDDTLVTEVINLDGSVGQTYAGLYDLGKLETKDKYSVFLGGNNAQVHVTHESGDYPTLLVIKDSFFHSLAPFLSCHYNMVILDLRYFRGDFDALYASLKPDAVLLCWGINELATSNYAILNTFLAQ